MCELCEDELGHLDEKDGLWAIERLPFADPELRYYSNEGNVALRIKYCPMCGRKLDEE